MASVIEMPKLSDTMTVGTLANWLKKEGDTVEAGDILAEVETDKATMEVEAFEDGVLLKLYAEEGDEVAIGGPIAAIGEKGEDPPEVEQKEKPKADKKEKDDDEDEGDKGDKDKEKAEDSADEKEEEAAQDDDKDKDKKSAAKEEKKEADDGADKEPAQPAATTGEATPPPPETDEGRVKASPLARKVAAELGVDLTQVEGTGPHGRIVREDVEKAAKEGTAKPAAKESAKPSVAPVAPTSGLGELVAPEEREKVSNMRATIARRLVEAKTEAPHFYLQTEIDAAPLLDLRASVNAKLKAQQGEGAPKFTVNDYILKACVAALRMVPTINRSWHGDYIQQHGAVHLAFGVAVPEGLLTPVIRDAHAKSLRQISSEARDLIAKARGKKLKPEEMSGATFTVTNLGMYGITEFYGIINPPNAAILSVGATVEKPVVVDGEITVGRRMGIGLSGDHRTIDGAKGAEFLAALREVLETPALMLV